MDDIFIKRFIMEAQLPNNFQVELVEGCTRMCSFCGIYSIWKNKEDRKINFMDFKLTQKIADDIGQWIPKRRIEFAMHGEPTLYPKLVEVIEYYRNKISESQLMITTNGTKLTEDLTLGLFKVGLNILVIDTYTKREEIIELMKKTIEKNKSIKLEDYYYDENPTNIYYYHNPKIKIITLLEDFAKTNRPGSKMIKAQRIILNHAGNSNVKLLKEKFGIPIIYDWLQKKCSRPFREMTVHWDGTVPICCMDWLHEFIIDKFTEKRGLKNIWNDLIFNIIRNLHYNKYRGFLPCYRCSYKGGFYLGFLKPVPLQYTQEQMLGILSSYHNQMKKYAHKNAINPFFPPQKNLRKQWINK